MYLATPPTNFSGHMILKLKKLWAESLRDVVSVSSRSNLLLLRAQQIFVCLIPTRPLKVSVKIKHTEICWVGLDQFDKYSFVFTLKPVLVLFRFSDCYFDYYSVNRTPR
jgi:hypothetical protein